MSVHGQAPPGVKIIALSGIPFIIAPTGTMANNGGVTLGTALPTIYGNAYIFLPAGAIAAGVPAASTWYFCQMSSTTVGIVFNNIYTTGVPTIPSSPTAFVTTGPGAYTGVIANAVGPQITVPAGTVGPNGALRTYFINSVNANTNSKTLIYKIGSTNLCATALNTAGQFGTSQWFTIVNSAAQNVNVAPNSSMTGGFGANPAAPPHPAINFGADQTLALSATMAVATDFIVMEAFIVEVLNL